MKVVIYDLVHLDWIIPYIELLDETSIEVYFYVSKDFKDDIEMAVHYNNVRFHWNFVDAEQGQLSFLIKAYLFFSRSKPDLVILNSIDGKYLLIYFSLVFARVKRVIVNVHAINNFLRPNLSLAFKKTIRTLSKKILDSKVSGYIVNAKTMREFVLKNSLTSKTIFWLPPVFYKQNILEKVNDGKIILLIPGAIDERRRDYNLVMEVFAHLGGNVKQVKLVLAGRPVGDYGLSILGKVKKLIREGLSIEFFESEVPENEFQKLVAGATLVVSPLVVSTVIHDQIEEKYGQTKTSGNIFDAIRHGKPLIIPDYIMVPEEIKSSCIVYSSSNDLYEKILELINDQEQLNEYICRAKANASFFSKEKVKEQLLNIIYNNEK